MFYCIGSAISLYQDSRSRNALEKLKDFTKPKSKVIRNGGVISVKTEDLVIGDNLVAEEGTSIAADGVIIHSNDFSVNESLLSGESLSLFKDENQSDNLIYQGTTVSSGLAIAVITAIGSQTRLNKIGQSLENIKEEKTPLELQIWNFVKKMVIAGFIIFILVWGINYFHSNNLLDSLLKALTLAMSILPEEIPVAFTTFMALGAWHLMKQGIVVKQMKTVETLGSATVICTDKTGTITENKMSLSKLFVPGTNLISSTTEPLNNEQKTLVTYGMWASESIPFDPMEIELHAAYRKIMSSDARPFYQMIHEYPLGGKPPMMTHIFQNQQGDRIIATKGAPEALIKCSNLTDMEKNQIEKAIDDLTKEGYRVLAVGEAFLKGDNFPTVQQSFQFDFKGLLGFYDPPKENIPSVLEAFYNAGIAVKIITGDNTNTTIAIARQIGFAGAEKVITGDELMALNDYDLQQTVMKTNVFTRMFPEAKLRIINALKAENQIVAMTGDGVNDGPALKAAHIGIAMGKKGTEIARQAASLILLEDDLGKMVNAIAMGRRIYTNLKKAIRYIISIHIPIILTVFIPLVLGWVYPNIFSPVHIIFLELIMGPTCSIIYENEPTEKDAMLQKPRPFTVTFFNFKELLTSVVQGLMITAGTLFIYQYAVNKNYNEALTRTMVFTGLIAANIFFNVDQPFI
ncbi:cation-translocating P-type ATPase [Pedobacter sp. NJ-S-72]